jgi:NADPH:quinone reductase-like Zn-dependent oxidoreductase
MRAVMLDGPGAPFRLADVARPNAAAGQVLVKIAASGVNPLDLKIRAGEAAHARHPLPGILGIDLAGIVEDVGAGVSGFRQGDAVYGMTGGVGGVQGSLAEYAAVDADLLARAPANLSMREAASLPLVLITAWEGLVDRARVSAGQSVLIQGGAGGIGTVAIQIARAFGAEVFATGRAASAAQLRAAGAIAIDRDRESADMVREFTGGRGFDIIYDTVGGAVLDASFASVARFGHVVSALGWGSHALAPLSFRAGTYSGVFTLLPLLTGEGRARHGAILAEAAAMIEAGKIVPRVDPRAFALDDVERAHEAVRAGGAGKIVVSV